ncbi:hypothetical protein [Larsenimonas rhizosphaerae]|uniref:hypothetical protein n=1 Tax=Larsenimonas rhizosphaerae TaxID=2944682 RepID=UPI0020343EFC|nr:hypothetical protein [Larsenimonas rhizosphaerae]MCM2130730.1 hypothetical protein [Larsenimonas rhizosphaerae]
MQDLFLARGDAIKQQLLHMESQAAEDDLFALGYLIPQTELVQEMADYNADDVTADDFDETFEHWLLTAFDQDHMGDTDRQRITELWQNACHNAAQQGNTAP